jgi:hypothetical protein
LDEDFAKEEAYIGQIAMTEDIKNFIALNK